MGENESRLAEFVRRCVRGRSCLGLPDDQVRAGVLADVERGYSLHYSDPAVADLLPGYLAVAREAVDGELDRLKAERN